MSERRPFSLAARLTVLLALALLALQVGVFAWTLHARSVEQFRLIASDRARLAMTCIRCSQTFPPPNGRPFWTGWPFRTLP